MGFWESLAYAIARGIARAWFDAMDERELSVREVPNAEDRVRAANMRNGVLRRIEAGDSGPKNPASGG